MRKYILAGLAVSGALVGQTSFAAVFVEGNSAAIDNKVKAFSDGSHLDQGMTVFGQTTAESQLVKFTGNTTIKITSGSGYAQINDPTADTSPWNQLTITPDNAAFGFTGIEFALQFNNADVSNSSPGTLTVTANFFSGGPEVFQVTDFKNPSNRSFYLTAGAGQVLKSIVLSSGADRLDQLKQTDIILVAAPAVPEPATWAMMIGGLGLVGAQLRRRRTAVSFA